ncbi:unnamed protein product, partial [Urochloa humidicola]
RGGLQASAGVQRAQAEEVAAGSCGLRTEAGAASSWAPGSARLGGGGGGLRKRRADGGRRTGREWP